MNRNNKAFSRGIVIFLIFIGLTSCNKIKQIFGGDSNKIEDQISLLMQTKIDSLKTTRYFTDREIRTYLQGEFESFYRTRNYQLAWNSTKKSFSQAESLLEAIDLAPLEGLQADDYNAKEMRAFQDQFFSIKKGKRKTDANLHKLMELDFLMTSNYLMYASHLLSGRIDPQRVDTNWISTPKKKNLAEYLEKAITKNRVKESLQDLLPKEPQYTELKKKLAEFRIVEARGSWPVIPGFAKKGDAGASVTMLKRRLALSGDLDSSRLDNAALKVFGDDLVIALKDYQARNGLTASGKVDKETLASLNIPVNNRIQQIELNMERIRWLPESFGDDYILVNVPEFRLKVFEKDKSVMDMRVIVGKEFTSTPIFNDTIQYLVFSPDWTVPSSIAKNEILPIVQRNPAYLTKEGFEVYSNWNVADTTPVNIDTVQWAKFTPETFNYRVVQKSGIKNPLGHVKFMMRNKMFIYLHDTPGDYLFDAKNRKMSHGCVRVERPVDLAEYLLEKDGQNISKDTVSAYMALDKPRIVTLNVKMPVQITYRTAWIDQNGKLNFRSDIYNHDKVQSKALIKKESIL